jgi:hypothetical protein
MGHRRGTIARLAGAAAIAVAGTTLAFGGASAAAAPGDTFYVSEAKKTFVSFVVPAGAQEVQKLAYAARKLRCSNGKVDKGGMVSLDRTVPVQVDPTGQSYFDAFWAARAPSFGGISGDLGDADRIDGVVDVRIRKRKKVTCESGLRKWTATPVSEEAWLAARDRAGIPVIDFP